MTRQGIKCQKACCCSISSYLDGGRAVYDSPDKMCNRIPHYYKGNVVIDKNLSIEKERILWLRE